MNKILNQSYKPGLVKPKYMTPLTRSFVECPNDNDNEVAIINCHNCTHKEKINLSTVECKA